MCIRDRVHILDRRLAQRQAEVAFLGFVGVADTIDDLLDVHLPAGRLAQVELGVGDLAAAQCKSPAEDAQSGDKGVELSLIHILKRSRMRRRRSRKLSKSSLK